ncbi:hypothetical protein F5X99DRAFT_328840 [Biscogniauxia marginata]|nr:hypothetical protein F5X99DRAFT_328840 [Biscogniauxia marginata]
MSVRSKNRKARWRTLSPDSRAAKVAAQKEWRAVSEAKATRSRKAAKAKAAAVEAGATGTATETMPKDARTPEERLAARKERKERRREKRKTARQERKRKMKEIEPKEMESVKTARPKRKRSRAKKPQEASKDSAVTSTEEAMPDAPGVEVKAPKEDKVEAPQKQTQKPDAEAEAATSGDDNGGAKLLRRNKPPSEAL